jgi:lysozyme family protein
MTPFEHAFAIVVGHEGGYDATRADPGNWTGGAVGVGELRGTKFGISAAAYPKLDIAGLTQDQAAAIYKPDYWDRVRCDDLPPQLALLVFDAAVNNGVDRATRWLQGAVGTPEDGVIGPGTLAALTDALARQGGAAICAEFMARRMDFMANLPTWREFGLGWARRLSALPYQSLTMES